MIRKLVTIREAAKGLGVHEDHIWNLIKEADTSRLSRWRYGREIIDLSRVGASRRTLRINLHAISPSLAAALIADDSVE